MSIYRELWTGETIKAFRNQNENLGFLNEIRSYDGQVANNNTIHFVDLGGDPEVLINNTTYPIGVESLNDTDKAIALDKYQTKASNVSDDEIRGISYDVKNSVIVRHIEALNQIKYKKALHALAPASHSSATPVVPTTGTTVNSRKQMKVEDIITLKQYFDNLRVPRQGRVLVLCPEHANALLQQDVAFATRYNDAKSGKIANIYGFDVYENVDTPVYVSNEKAAYGATATTNDQAASVAFYAPRMMKAASQVTAYIDEPDTQNQTWRYNIRHYFICLPLKNEAIGAIVSAI